MTYLDEFPLDDMPEDAKNLLHLLLSMVMVSFPIECWGQGRVPDTGAAYLDLLVEPGLEPGRAQFKTASTAEPEVMARPPLPSSWMSRRTPTLPSGAG